MDIKLSEVRLLFNLDTITSIAVASNWLFIVVGPTTIVRINLDSPSNVQDITIPKKYPVRIHKIYASPQGTSVLAVTEDLNHFFYCEKYPKPEFELISKLKSTPTAAVAFHPTREGLLYLATQNGILFNLQVDTSSPGSYFRRDFQSLTQLWKSERKDPITQLFITKSAFYAVSGPRLLKWADLSFQSSPKLLAVNSFDVDILHASISPDKQTICAVLDSQHVGYFTKSAKEWVNYELSGAKYVLCSNHHLIAITDQEITAISTITNKVSKSTEIDLGGTPIHGVASDLQQSTYWLYTTSSLCEIKLQEELNGMYKLLADEGKFEEALKVADSSSTKSYVLEKYGYHMLPTNAKLGAQLLGQSSCNLDVCALKVIEVNRPALPELLLARLKHTKSKTQQIILTSWLAELGTISIDELVKYEMQIDIVKQILLNKGDYENYVKMCVSTDDVSSAINLYISQSNWAKSLELIRTHGLHSPKIVYKFAPKLLLNSPTETVNSLLKLDNLDTVQLLPSLLAYTNHFNPPINENEALRFLTHVFKAKPVQPESVCLAMLSLLCSLPEPQVFEFVKVNSNELKNYDFALRLLLENGHFKPAIHLYEAMNLYEEAVNLCLSGNLSETDLAIDIANKVDNDELRKTLLIQISKFTVAKEGPQAALKFVNMLNIGELLAQFPEFDKIEDLSPEVVKSLEQAKSKLIAVNAEIDESIKASEDIKKEIRMFAKKSVLVEPGEPCYECRFPLTTRKFIIYPCQHGFHLDCTPGNCNECKLCSISQISQIEKPLGADF